MRLSVVAGRLGLRRLFGKIIGGRPVEYAGSRSSVIAFVQIKVVPLPMYPRATTCGVGGTVAIIACRVLLRRGCATPFA